MNNIVPENWNLCKIGDHIKVLTDYTANGSFASLKENVKYFGEKNYAALVRLTDLEKDAFDPQRFTDKKGYEYLKKSYLKSGDIVIANVGSTGKAYRIPNASIPMTLAPNMYLIKFHDSLDEDFAFQLITNQQFYSDLISKIGSSTLNAINKSNFRSISILKPPLPEQKKIAFILTSVDEVIENTQKQIDKLQDLKKATMNKLLTKGIGHTEFKDSQLGRIPKSWECLKMGDLAKVTDGAHKTPKYIESGVPFLRVTDIQSTEINVRKTKYISNSEHLDLCRRCKPEKGDIIYSKNGTIGISKIVNWDWDFSIFVSLALLKLHDKNVLQVEFLDLFLQSPLVAKQIKDRAKQGTVTNLHLEEIKNFDVVVPSTEEQSEIKNIIGAIESRIHNVKQKLTQTQSLKKSLTQDLLTGKVRVSIN